MGKRILTAVSVLLLVIALSSCSDRTSRDPWNTGSSITPDAIDSLYAELETEKKDEGEESDAATETEYPYGLDGEQTVYWYGNLPIYHTSENCVHVKTAENVESSSLAEALEKGRADLCDECAVIDGLK